MSLEETLQQLSEPTLTPEQQALQDVLQTMRLKRPVESYLGACSVEHVAHQTAAEQPHGPDTPPAPPATYVALMERSA